MVFDCSDAIGIRLGTTPESPADGTSNYSFVLPVHFLAKVPVLQSNKSLALAPSFPGYFWLAFRDLNPGQHGYEPRALAI